ncbi:Nitrate transporter 1.4 [Acorus calamus]|uniref:Nitrate transporter 1.4 n=1 Tax=Acorus calamus TaxID=4465 RepID=A0AAV9DPG5_ACOCL|nr:Nitrate transporter 1.4 [Acorus calamus]
MSWATVADAVDYKGFPADKSKTGGWVSAALILDRFALMSLPSHNYFNKVGSLSANMRNDEHLLGQAYRSDFPEMDKIATDAIHDSKVNISAGHTDANLVSSSSCAFCASFSLSACSLEWL